MEKQSSDPGRSSLDNSSYNCDVKKPHQTQD